MTDDRDDSADAMLIQASRDYNAATSVPRDEMWARIEAVRRSRGRTASRRAYRGWYVGAIAATLVMAVGVAIGRRWERSSSVSQLAGATHSPSAATSVASPTDPSTSLSYRLVVLKHFANSEALITAFRSAAKRGEVDDGLRDWSKEMLSMTRMLEATGSEGDPTLKRLLSDLDLVLTQIKLYTSRGTNDASDLDLIEESIHSRGVMTKLRSTLPARVMPAGT